MGAPVCVWTKDGRGSTRCRRPAEWWCNLPEYGSLTGIYRIPLCYKHASGESLRSCVPVRP